MDKQPSYSDFTVKELECYGEIIYMVGYFSYGKWIVLDSKKNYKKVLGITPTKLNKLFKNAVYDYYFKTKEEADRVADAMNVYVTAYMLTHGRI